MTAQQQEQINFQDQAIESIYPQVRDAWRKVPELPYWITAQDRVYRRFQIITQDFPVRRRIDGMHRIAPGGGKEFLFVSQTLISEDSYSNQLTFDSIQHKCEVPHFHKEWIPENSRIEAVSVDHTEVVYDLEFNESNLKDLLADCTQDTRYYLHTDAATNYSISRASFIEDSFEDATEAAKTGRRVRN